MEQSLLTVERRDDTRWHVCDAELGRSLASFGFKEDALEYARDLVAAWSGIAPDGVGADPKDGGGTANGDANRIGARAAASLAAGAIKKPAMSRA
jgi:hypothetical protein